MESTSTITIESINKFKFWLRLEERSEGTITKYIRDVKRLFAWLNGREFSKESLTEWKEHLTECGYEPVTVNSMLAVINTYCRFVGLNIKLKFLRIQRKLFQEESKELNKDKYERLAPFHYIYYILHTLLFARSFDKMTPSSCYWEISDC